MAKKSLISGDLSVGGKVRIQVLSQAAEPTLSEDGQMVVWIDSDDSNRVYLVFRRGSGDQVKVEFV